MSNPGDRYVLQHSEAELRRLEAQGAFLRPSTRHFLQGAGLEPGMRVLDIGAGAGDVLFVAADLIGPSGGVIGVDHGADALSLAMAGAHQKQLADVRFVQGDLDSLEVLAGERRFDAVIGRLVIIHQPDPAAAVAQLIRLVRPGGVVGFHEIDLDAESWSTHPIPALDDLWRWVGTIVKAGRFSGQLGPAFLSAFEEHKLVERRVIRGGYRLKHWSRPLSRKCPSPAASGIAAPPHALHRSPRRHRSACHPHVPTRDQDHRGPAYR